MNLYVVTYKKYSETLTANVVASSVVHAIDGAYRHMGKAHYRGVKYEVIAVEKTAKVNWVVK
jgi:ribosomal protein L20A (L18A)